MMENNLTEEQLQRIQENRQKALEKRQAARKKELRSEIESKESIEGGYSTPTSSSKATFDDERKVGFRSPVIHQITPNKSSTGLLNSSVPSAITSEPSKVVCEHILPETNEICGNPKIDQQLYETFQEKVCVSCKIANPKVYGLLSKQECMKQFLLPEDTFQLFNHINKPNPHNQHWMPMKLYLVKQIHASALFRFGSEEKIEEERQKREEVKYQKSLLKTENLLQEKSNEFRSFIDQQKQSAEQFTAPSATKSNLEIAVNNDSAQLIDESDSPLHVLTDDKTSKKRQAKTERQKKLNKKQKFLNNFLPSILGSEQKEKESEETK